MTSIPKHFKPGCDPSLIDNISTNSIDNILMAYVFQDGISHRHPIASFVDDVMPKKWFILKTTLVSMPKTLN